MSELTYSYPSDFLHLSETALFNHLSGALSLRWQWMDPRLHHQPRSKHGSLQTPPGQQLYSVARVYQPQENRPEYPEYRSEMFLVVYSGITPSYSLEEQP